MSLEFLMNPEFWKHVSIPLVAAVVGWVTNWVAIKLTFLPLEFRGLRPIFGWQGIIPSKAGKMAAIFAESTMFRLGTLEEIFRHMEPDRMAQHIVGVIGPRIQGYTDEVMFWGGNGPMWRTLPSVVKRRIYARVKEGVPRLVDDLMEDIAVNVEELVDFKDMLVSQLESDKALLNRLFLEAGEAEFRFIIRSGFWFGLVFGLVQLTVWVFYKGWWVLPVFGLIVGWATNWIALNLIFRPLHPTRIWRWTVQGLFLRRQKQVAAVWCRLVTRNIVTIRQIIHAMLNGPRSESTHGMIRRHIRPLADEALGVLKPAVEVAVGEDTFEEIRESIEEKAVLVSADPFNDWSFNEERAVVLERLLRERMEGLPPEEFQDLLRPCFQEDEWKLILTGAVLGFLAGLGQLIFVFGGFSG